MYKSFLTATIISLFYCCENFIILMNIWMIGKNVLPEKEDFYSRLSMEDITDADYAHAIRFLNKKCKRISWFLCSERYC